MESPGPNRVQPPRQPGRGVAPLSWRPAAPRGPTVWRRGPLGVVPFRSVLPGRRDHRDAQYRRPHHYPVAADGAGKLETLTLKGTRTGGTEIVPAGALFIGAVPHTGWLPPGISRDEHGFILTGSDLPLDGSPAARWPLPRPPFPLETSMPGVFTVGDLPHASVKRVASAVGEGSIASTQMYQYLQAQAGNL